MNKIAITTLIMSVLGLIIGLAVPSPFEDYIISTTSNVSQVSQDPTGALTGFVVGLPVAIAGEIITKIFTSLILGFIGAMVGLVVGLLLEAVNPSQESYGI